jgi:Domain of unknown function (DUF4157)
VGAARHVTTRSERRRAAGAPASGPLAAPREGDLARLQRSAGNRAVAAALAGGQPLDPATRALAETRFGEDFAGVRVHTDAAAALSARALGASAYTVGSDIAFAQGRYDPHGPGGRRLLGHELAHVVQQRRGGASARAPAIERSAREAGEGFAGGAAALEVEGASAVGLDRQQEPNAPAAAAPTPVVRAANPLVPTMAEFASVRPSSVASGLYEGDVGGHHLRLTQPEYEELRRKVREQLGMALRRSESRVETAAGRYAEQQKVDAHHWIVAPIVKALGRVKDPGPVLERYVADARARIPEARKTLEAGDFVRAAELTGEAEGDAERAATMVAAYVDQIIGTAEMTVTVLEGVKTASEIVLFLCAVAATGGAAAGVAGSLGIEVTAGSAAAAGWITAGAAVAGEVGVGIVKAADGEKVDWGEIAVHAAIQAIMARFSGSVGQRLANGLAANPLVARYGTQRVVSVATSILMAEGSNVFATTVDDTVRALRGKDITWAQFGQHLFARLTDPRGLLMAAVAGALGGGPYPERKPPAEGPPAPAAPKPPAPPPKKSPTDNASWRDVNKALGIKGPSGGKKATPAPTPPPGHKQVTAEEAFRPTAQETAAAYAGKAPAPPSGKQVLESANASPRGQTFQSASAATRRSLKTATRPDVGESEGYKAALEKGEIGLERPQGVNVSGRADFITAARDANGKLWIIANDAKTVSSPTSSHPTPTELMPSAWRGQVKAAVDRASVGNPALEAELAAAYAAGRVTRRQVNVDYRPSGQGAVTGITPPSPVPWSAMVPPVRFEDDKGR